MIDPVVQSVLDALPVGVILIDADLTIVAANTYAAELLTLSDTIDKCLASGTGDAESSHYHWTEQLKDFVSAKQSRCFENIVCSFNGKTNPLRITCIPLLETASSQIPAIGVVIVQNICKNAQLQRDLANSERFATLGRLASRIAHELNGPLDGILRYISLALRSVEKEGLEKPQEYLTRCQQGLMRMVHILSELLEFSRGTRATVEYAPVEQIIEEAIKIMSAKVETPEVRILRDYAGNVPHVRSGNLFQVFCNIIKNAFDAMPEGGELHVSTRMAPDNTIAIEFQDTGVGFAPENAEAIFKPFFTTKETGTGLGLAICKDIVEQHHGRITAKNAPEGGSIFTVYLPLADQV